MSENPLNWATLTERRAMTSVKFGSLYHSPNQINAYVRKSAELLVCLFPECRHELSLRGSATSLRYRDRYWVISTRHQIKATELELAGILVELPNRYLTSERCIWLGSPDESDQYDLFAWEFTAPVREGKLAESHFLPLLESGYLKDGDNVIGGFVYGYRTADLRIDWEDDCELGPRMSHIHLPQQEIFCEYHGNGYEDTIARLVAQNFDLTEADGLSGSPAFLFVQEHLEFSCKFAGIVVRGGNRNFYVAKHTVIRRLLDKAIMSDG